MGVISTCMSVYHMCLVPTAVRRKDWIPWNWSYKYLQTIIWVLGIEPRSSVRETKALIH